MAHINKSAIVPYTTAQMYDLVNDINAYPDFVPACYGAEIASQSDDEIRAKLTFIIGGFKKSFSTCNRLQKNKMIEMRLLDGPFSRLEGFWQFEPVGENQCRVSFNMEFDFSSKVVGIMFEPAFTRVSDKLVDAFCERARQVYGDAS